MYVCMYVCLYVCLSVCVQLCIHVILVRQQRMIVDVDDVSETERVYQCDLVLLAMGFVGPEQTILEELGLSQDSRGNIDASTVKYMTSVPRVYTAGGMYRVH